jgi:cell division protein FtsI/penicillin-binding protein 2
MWKRLFSFEGDPPVDPAARAVRASAPVVVSRDPVRGDTAVFSTWRPLIRRRLAFVVAALAVWAVAIEVRLVFVQVVHAAEYRRLAENQQERTLRPAGRRGDIVDRHGRLLAYSVQAHAIESDPSVIEDGAATVRQLCAALGDCTKEERTDLTAKLSSGRPWAPVRKARQVSPDQLARVEALALPGIVLLPEALRFYPHLSLAAQVIGFVGSDHDGRAGVESRFDDAIRGLAGLTLIQKDNKQRRITTRVQVEPTAGATVELTLDLNLQHVAERELRIGMEEHRAEAGTVIVMDPRTGEIRALANYPTFNPNAPGRFPPETWKNRAVQDIYEPGSTFKIVTAAAALEEGVLRPCARRPTRWRRRTSARTPSWRCWATSCGTPWPRCAAWSSTSACDAATWTSRSSAAWTSPTASCST